MITDKEISKRLTKILRVAEDDDHTKSYKYNRVLELLKDLQEEMYAGKQITIEGLAT